MLALQTAISPVSSPFLDIVTAENQALDNQQAYDQNTACGNEEEEVDIVGKSFSFPQLTPPEQAKEQPSPVARAAIPGLSSPKEYKKQKNSNLGGKKRPMKKASSANRPLKKHQVSFARQTRSKSKKFNEEETLMEDKKEEEEEEDEEAQMEVQLQPADDTIATTVYTPYSAVHQKKQKRGKKNRQQNLASSAATAAMAKQPRRDNDNRAEYSENAPFDDSQTKDRLKLAAATAELQTAVQQARTMLPYPIPAAGLLAMASKALQNDTPASNHNIAYVIKCLSIVATLIPAVAAEIARGEQHKIPEVGAGAGAEVEAPAGDLASTAAGTGAATVLPLLPRNVLDKPSNLPSWPLRIPTHTTLAAVVAPQKDEYGLISLQNAALTLKQQQQQQQQQVSFPQSRQMLVIDDPMDALNRMLGIQMIETK